MKQKSIAAVFFTFALALLLLSGCGYKPTSFYSKQVLGNLIYAEVETSLKDPENTVLIRDAINEAIVDRFKSKIVPEDKADTKLFIKLNKVSFQPIQYDKNGYVIAYKTYVDLKTRYTDKQQKQKTIISSGEYDFPIASNSVISDTKRFEAIKNASEKAIGEFISKISAQGLLSDYQ